jgi:demethoxyubiquinone hydroxylase (CLK1/Coq7/Cat5 family)
MMIGEPGETRMVEPQTQTKPKYDISIIRPELRSDAFKLRGEGFPPARLAAIRKGLRTFHTLELMAQTIYRFQITRQQTEMNRQLIAALCNEMGHYQDDQVKLLEYGFRPSILRAAYWMVGVAFGLSSRLLGEKAILRTGIWVESKAVRHYAELLATIDWDDETRKVLEKDQADEDGHIRRWKTLLQGSGQQ